MKGFREVDRNILEYLFVSFPCFNSACSAKIVVSLDSLYKNSRIKCPACKKENTIQLNSTYLNVVHRYFDDLYKQLHNLDFLPLAFSLEIAPKSVFLDYMSQDNTSEKLL